MARLANPATLDKGCVIVPRSILQYPTMAMFISWNCRGFVTNHAELQLLLRDTQPLIVFLQETLLKPTDNPKVKGYTLHRLNYTAGERAQGGVIILYYILYFIDVQCNHSVRAMRACFEDISQCVSVQSQLSRCI
jgi:hypothetical protein